MAEGDTAYLEQRIQQLESTIRQMLDRERELSHLDLPENFQEQVAEVSVGSLDERLATLEAGRQAGYGPQLVSTAGGTYVAPYTMLPATLEGAATAQTDTWDRDNPPVGTDGVIYKGPRVVYDDTAGTPKILGYNREVTYDSAGAIAFIAVEVEYNIDTPGACP